MSNLSTLLQTMSDLSGTLTTPGGTVIYENQIRAGRSIVDCFTNDQHSTILFSQFQAGKTGVAVYVAMEMTGQTGQSDGSGLAEEVFFVCGMNDLSIKRQAQSRFHGLKNVTILFNYDIQRMVDEKVRLTDRKILVIVDESQFGSSRQSELHKLLIEVFGIDPAVEHYNWANQKSYYLSISATPFTEEVANHLFKPSKTIIRLEPGRGYRGVKYLLEHNFIQESFKLETPDDYSRLVNLLGFDEPGYYIIRLENEAYRADCESYLKSATGGSTFVLTSKGSTLKLTSDNFINLHCKNEEVTMNINDYLTREPDRPIIIFIYRSLSASYTPYFRYVNAGFEAAGEAIETTTQRLVGRACGYYDWLPPTIYTSSKQVKEYQTYLEASNSKSPIELSQFPLSCRDVKSCNKKYQGTSNIPFLLNVKKYMSRLKGKTSQLKRHLSEIFNDPDIYEQIGSLENRRIITDNYETMGTSRVWNSKIIKEHNTIFKWWNEGLQAFFDQSPWYTSHKEKSLNQAPKCQKYVYLQGLETLPYYGYLIVASMKNCQLREYPVDVVPTSMYNPKSSYRLTVSIQNKIKLSRKLGGTPFMQITFKIPLALKGQTSNFPQKIPLKRK